MEGSIIIDDVDAKTVGLIHLRRHISIIPQEPVLFSASMRFNLDPFNEFDDGALWNALEEVSFESRESSFSSKVVKEMIEILAIATFVKDKVTYFLVFVVSFIAINV